MKNRLLICLLAWLTTLSVNAQIGLCGYIYLKNGERINVTDGDRLYAPQNQKNLIVYRDYFGKKTKVKFSGKTVDSLVCWHPGHPDMQYTFRFIGINGWMAEYYRFSNIRVLIYSPEGYVVNYSGGFEAVKDVYSTIHSKVWFFLEKDGTDKLQNLGEATKKVNDIFKKNICAFIADDPTTCTLVEESTMENRSKLLALLENYQPGK